MINFILASVDSATATAAAHVATDGGNNAIMQIVGQFGIKPHLLLAQIVNFTIVALIINFFVLKPIQKSLDDRAKAIDEGLKRAEESEKTLVAANTQKDEIIGQARREVQTIVDKTQKEMQAYETLKRAEAQKESAALLEKAKRDLIAEHDQQITSAQKELAALVVTLAEKSLEETLTPDQKNRFAEKVATTISK